MLKLVKGAVVALAAAGTLVPSAPVQAATSFPQVKSIKTIDATLLDVALTSDGTLVGRVIDHTGAAVENREVLVRQGKTEVAKTTTDKSGTFVVTNLKGGMYEVASGNTTATYRVWTESAAPESAGERVMLVLGENGARGNGGVLLGNGTLLLVAGILAAIIISAITLSEVNKIPKSN